MRNLFFLFLMFLTFSINAQSKTVKKKTSCITNSCCSHNLPYRIGINDTTKDINTANLKIENAIVKPTGTSLILTASISANDEGNNDARNVEVFVMLPAEVNVLKITGPNWCLIPFGHPSNTNLQAGYVKFSKESMGKDGSDNFKIQIETSMPVKTDANKPNFSIYVFNQNPEIIYKDNFWYWN